MDIFSKWKERKKMSFKDLQWTTNMFKSLCNAFVRSKAVPPDAIFKGGCHFSKSPQIFRRFGPRSVIWRRQDARSAGALFESRASNTTTAKRPHLPTNITAKERTERFHVIAITPIRVVSRKNCTHCRRRLSKNASHTEYKQLPFFFFFKISDCKIADETRTFNNRPFHITFHLFQASK